MKLYTNTFISAAIILGIYVLIDVVWQALKLLFHHQIMPSPEDSVMGAVLAVSLYHNLHIKIVEKDDENK